LTITETIKKLQQIQSELKQLAKKLHEKKEIADSDQRHNNFRELEINTERKTDMLEGEVKKSRRELEIARETLGLNKDDKNMLKT